MTIGIAVPEFGASQRAFEIITRVNSYLSKDPLRSVVGFFENISSLCFIPNFPVMPINEIYGFEGPIITNNLKTAEIAINIKTSHPMYYYIWDLEWMNYKNPAYENIMPIYNSKLSIISRANDHAILLRKLWNRKIKVVENFDLEKIL